MIFNFIVFMLLVAICGCMGLVLFDLHRLLREVSPNCNDDTNQEFKPKNKFYPLYLDVKGVICKSSMIPPKIQSDCASMGTLFGYIYVTSFDRKKGKMFVVFGYKGSSAIGGSKQNDVFCFEGQTFTYDKSKCKITAHLTDEIKCYLKKSHLVLDPEIIVASDNTIEFKISMRFSCPKYAVLDAAMQTINPISVKAVGVSKLNRSQQGSNVLSIMSNMNRKIIETPDDCDNCKGDDCPSPQPKCSNSSNCH